MTDLQKFVEKNNVECSKHLVDEQVLSSLLQKQNIQPGAQLLEYLLKYGYLAHKHIEFYGINARQLDKSDMLVQTAFLHENYLQTTPYVAIENRGDGDYILVDKEDSVYEFIPSLSGDVKNLNNSLFGYIYAIFDEINVTVKNSVHGEVRDTTSSPGWERDRIIILETGALPSPIREKFRMAKVSMRDCDDGGVVLSPLR